MTKKQGLRIFIGAIALLSLVSGSYFYAFKTAKKTPELPQYALYYEQPREIASFALTDHHGHAFDNSSLLNHWTWIFLGYTSCPDICPITLQKLTGIYPKLKGISEQTQVVLLTADPLRDSQEKLSQYIAYFHDDFLAVRAGHEVLFPFTRNLGLMYSLVEEAQQDHYFVNHSASLVLINPQGNIAAIFKPEHSVGQVPTIVSTHLMSDFKRIVALND